MLFVAGPDPLSPPPRIAIVGTRQPTPWGEEMAAACARACAEASAPVVSGLAEGIDAAAHRAVVDAGGQTWAILPSGLDVAYPAHHSALASSIVDMGGALVSEYLPGTRLERQFFVERDRLQAALSEAVVVVETARRGGTHHTIRFARQVEVPVWVTLPADLTTERGASSPATPEAQQGTRDLWIGGTPVVTPHEVAAWVARYRLGERARAPESSPQSRLF